MPRSRQLSVLLVAFCVAMGACGGDDGDDRSDRPQPTTTAPPTTASAAEEDEEALRQLAEDWYEAYNAIFRDRLPADGASSYLIEPYLAEFEEQVRSYLESGNQTEPSDRSRQTIEEIAVDGDRAVVTECIVNANLLVDSRGDVLNDEVGARRIETVALRGADGWRFSERRALADVEEAECDA